MPQSKKTNSTNNKKEETNFFLKYSKEISEAQKSVQPESNPYNYFNRFRLPTSDPFMSNVAYVFFTKPNLNLTANLNNDQYFATLNSTEFGQSILSSLTVDNYSPMKCSGNYIKILSNSIMNFETKDSTLKTSEYYENFIGYKMNLPSTFIESITADSITLNFMEYDDLRVTNLIKTWVTYIQNVKRGVFSPNDDYSKQKILDYASSIYFFLCGPDGHSIKYYTKLTGVYPVNIPYSSFSWEMSSTPDLKKLSIQFYYQIKEDLDPQIINDFSKLASRQVKDDDKAKKDDTLSDNWGSEPVITDSGLYFI